MEDEDVEDGEDGVAVSMSLGDIPEREEGRGREEENEPATGSLSSGVNSGDTAEDAKLDAAGGAGLDDIDAGRKRGRGLRRWSRGSVGGERRERASVV